MYLQIWPIAKITSGMQSSILVPAFSLVEVCYMETAHFTLQPWNIDGSLKGLFMLQNERSGCILSSRGRCTSFEIHIRKAKVAFQCVCDHGHGCIADHSWLVVSTVAPAKILAISTSHPMVEKHMSNRQPDMAS